MSDNLLLPAGTLVHGRYRVISQIGRGGMGAVYAAEDTRLSSQVALKQLLLGGEQVDRAFEREAKLLANLRHPALPVVSDYFAQPEGQFLVMQHIPGHDLGELLLRRGGPLPVAQVLEWADRLLDALAYLHEQAPPVIHRDIKPQNLKLTPRDEIYLLDFGLARGSAALQTRLTTGGSMLAYTPQYAPLEQIRGSGTDARSDLYALAATLHQLVTGATPLSALDRAAAVVEGRPDPLRPAAELNPMVPPRVSAVLAQALAMRPEDRPPTAADMRRALSEAVRPAPAPAAAPHTDPPATAALPAATPAATAATERGAPPWLPIALSLLALLILLAVAFIALRPQPATTTAGLAATALPDAITTAPPAEPTDAPPAEPTAASAEPAASPLPATPVPDGAPTATASASDTGLAAQPVASARPAVGAPQPPTVAPPSLVAAVLLREDFADPAGGWDPAYSSANGSNGYDAGGYRFSVARTPDWMMWDIRRTGEFGQAVYSVDVTLLDGAGKLGLFLGYSGAPAEPERASFYRIVVGTDGRLEQIQVRVGGADQPVEVARAEGAGPFAPGVPRRLSVRRGEGQLVVALDGVEIGRAADPGLQPGRVGLFGESGAGPVSVRYDNLEVAGAQ